ncbi:hypothetical protein B0H13DRAFT_2394029 [Mycena leptocephala]|nr:hypothetical protein B0H13DRAFT_2394029 [Mycena leptocephala]
MTPDFAYTNVLLDGCTAEYLGWSLDKSVALTNWRPDKGGLAPTQITYAAQDALACLRLYMVITEELRRKSAAINQTIPEGWYSFNSFFGKLYRIKESFSGEVIPWQAKDCFWYANGKFQSYP